MLVYIADDQRDVRCALKCTIEAQPGLQWAGEAANAAQLLAHLRTACPDLVLLDWELSGMRASILMTQIHLYCPTVRVIALSVSPEAYDEALRAGVHGFASKGDPPERLLAAIRRISAPI